MIRLLIIGAILLVAVGACNDDHDHDEHDHGNEEVVETEREMIHPGITAEFIREYQIDTKVSGQDLELACEVETSPEATIHILSLVEGRVVSLGETVGAGVIEGTILGTILSADFGAARLRHAVRHRSASLAQQRKKKTHTVHENLETLLAAVDGDGPMPADALPDLVIGESKGRLLTARNRVVAARLDAARVRSTAADLRALVKGLSTDEWDRPRDSLRAGEWGARLLQVHADRRLAYSIYARERQLAADGVAPKRRVDAARRDSAVARTNRNGLLQEAARAADAMDVRGEEDLASATAVLRAVVEDISLEMETHRLEEEKRDAEAWATLEVTHRELQDYGIDRDTVIESCDNDNAPVSSLWKIRAPARGTLIEQAVAQGQIVEKGSLLFSLADTSRLWVQCSVYDRDLARVAAAALPLTAEVRSRAYPGRVFSGSMDYLAAATDPATRTTRARVTVANDRGLLRPGSFVHATIRFPMEESLLEIPRRAVVDGAGHPSVFVKVKSTWARREVEVVEVAGEKAWVRGDVNVGDVIASRGAGLIDAEERGAAAGNSHGHDH